MFFTIFLQVFHIPPIYRPSNKIKYIMVTARLCTYNQIIYDDSLCLSGPKFLWQNVERIYSNIIWSRIYSLFRETGKKIYFDIITCNKTWNLRAYRFFMMNGNENKYNFWIMRENVSVFRFGWGLFEFYGLKWRNIIFVSVMWWSVYQIANTLNF